MRNIIHSIFHFKWILLRAMCNLTNSVTEIAKATSSNRDGADRVISHSSSTKIIKKLDILARGNSRKRTFMGSMV